MASFDYSANSENASRKERAAIAAQACQTCRTRKSKCDEQRPKCGLCRRLNVECQYREPLPTKKDKTMDYILDSLTRLETKVDNLALPTPTSFSPMPSTIDSKDSDKYHSPKRHMRSITTPHTVITWPSIYLHLVHCGIQAASDLHFLLQKGTPWLIHKDIARRAQLSPSLAGLQSCPLESPAGVYSSKVRFPSLTAARILEYTEAYFNTFDVLCPVLHQDAFLSELAMPLFKDGYADGDSKVVLALLVFALGQVALEGVLGNAINTRDGVPSGIRGGSLDEPPGMRFFNEAQRRLGFVVTECSLINVHILLLQSMYYETNARHMDFWRSTVSASMACQVLIECHPIDWASPFGDMIKRTYWACVLNENMYHFDLDLPETGIQFFEDSIPLPSFPEAHDGQGNMVRVRNERSHCQYHFLAMIALGKLITNIHSTILEPAATRSEHSTGYAGPPIPVIREMARQLELWRALLPRPLQWSDGDVLDFPKIDFSTRGPSGPLFAPDHGAVPIKHRYNLDIVTAQLRTRFYYARFVLYQPFIYKALHFPELLTRDDAGCCALAIKSACMWPIAMAPPKNKKRLVPHLFTWTQNFLSILLILEMTTKNDCLRQICQEKLDQDEIEMTITLLLDWIRDIKQIDGIADWSWTILDPLMASRR